MYDWKLWIPPNSYKATPLLRFLFSNIPPIFYYCGAFICFSLSIVGCSGNTISFLHHHLFQEVSYSKPRGKKKIKSEILYAGIKRHITKWNGLYSNSLPHSSPWSLGFPSSQVHAAAVKGFSFSLSGMSHYMNCQVEKHTPLIQFHQLYL